MELALLLAKQIVVMMLMLLVGFAARRAGFLPAGAGKAFSALVLYVLCPAILLSAFHMEFSMQKLGGLFVCAVAACVAFVFFWGLSHLSARLFSLHPIDRMSLIYPNSGNLIIPLVAAVLGREYIFYSSAYLAVMNVYSWVHADRVIGEKPDIHIRKILLNPNIVVIAIGLLLFVSGFPLPQILWNTAGKIGDCIGPVSMMTIGVLMSENDLKKVFANKKTYLISFLRLVIFPLLFILLICAVDPEKFFPGAGRVLIATVLAASAPPAVFVSQFAALYGKDTGDATAANVLSTLLCVLTMPVMILIYQTLYMS